MQLIQPPDTGIDWLDVGNSLMKAVQYALGWLIVWIGGLIQLPMMIVQFVMECLCYLFLPIAISLFAFESTKGLAIRYVQQTLAILAWPIGFAVVDLVGYSILTSVGSTVSAGALAAGLATGFTPVQARHRRHCCRLVDPGESRDAHRHADALLLGNAHVIGRRPSHPNGSRLCGSEPLSQDGRRRWRLRTCARLLIPI